MTADPSTASDERPAPDRVRETLGMDASAPIDPERALELLAGTLRALIGIDQVTTGAWGQMSPASEDRGGSRLAALARAVLERGSAEDRAALERELESARLLAVCLLAATPRAGQVAWRHVARLAPERIEGVAKAEKRWNESLEFACWRKYKELAGELDAAGFEDEVMSAIGAYVQTLMDRRRERTSEPGASA